MTLKEACAHGTNTLEQAGIEEAALDAWYLLEHVTGISRAMYFLDGGQEMKTAQEARYFVLIQKRAGHIPLQHLTGVQEFMGLPFRVNEHVLIPRQDTETLVEAALDILQNMNGPVSLLDMCTGSGCILLSILKLAGRGHSAVTGGRKTDPPCSGILSGSIPGRKNQAGFSAFPIKGTGVDISGRALETAAENARLLDVEAAFYESDLFERVEGRFSMIVSNPPYIRTSEIEMLQEEVKHDPVMALDGGEDGLSFYRKLVKSSRDYLLPKGYLLFEIGYDQAAEVAGLMRDAGFQAITVKKDLAGLDRVVSGVYDDKV